MKNKILFVVCLLMSLMLINSGFNKFFHYMELPEMSQESMNLMLAIVASKWLFPLIALVEIIGGVLFAIPKTRALGAIMIFPIVVGIVLLHAVQDPGTVGVAIVMLLINGWAIYENRAKYMPMIA